MLKLTFLLGLGVLGCSIFLSVEQLVCAQQQPIAVVGATLIDGTGRAPIADSAIVMQNGRFIAAGARPQVPVPQGAEVIDAKGETLLPGLIDGHCHLRDWMYRVYAQGAIPQRPFPKVENVALGVEEFAAKSGLETNAQRISWMQPL